MDLEESDPTLQHLLDQLQRKIGLSSDQFKLKFGYPPVAIDASSTALLSTIGIRSGETLILEKLAQSIGASGNQETRRAQSNPGTVVGLKTIDDDNTCLFHAISYAIDGHGRSNGGKYLREIVAGLVLSREADFPAAILGKPVVDYIAWIRDDRSWGGSIELAVLSDYFQVEIAVFTIASIHWQIFGEGKYDRRIYLAYAGIHYDVFQQVKPQTRSIFPSSEVSIMHAISIHGLQLQKDLAFTDTGSFTLKCDQCGKKLVGEKEAQQHAKQSGHSEFSEYHA